MDNLIMQQRLHKREILHMTCSLNCSFLCGSDPTGQACVSRLSDRLSCRIVGQAAASFAVTTQGADNTRSHIHIALCLQKFPQLWCPTQALVTQQPQKLAISHCLGV